MTDIKYPLVTRILEFSKESTIASGFVISVMLAAAKLKKDEPAESSLWRDPLTVLAHFCAEEKAAMYRRMENKMKEMEPALAAECEMQVTGLDLAQIPLYIKMRFLGDPLEWKMKDLMINELFIKKFDSFKGRYDHEEMIERIIENFLLDIIDIADDKGMYNFKMQIAAFDSADENNIHQFT